MWAEKMVGKPYRNEEARDSLFADLVQHQPTWLFLLGDMVSRGAKGKAWFPLDGFLKSLNKIHTQVKAIPGNHDYMGKSKGVEQFTHRFPAQWLNGYLVKTDSIVVVMLNSNFSCLRRKEVERQLAWYKKVMDSLDTDPKTKAVIVCTHHAPYSNSKVVGSSKPVRERIVPVFEKTHKAILFISGHSHNLEYFSDSIGKHFLVIGGGGGIDQPLIRTNKRIWHDLLPQEEKPRYFYLAVEPAGHYLNLIARGFKRNFRFFEFSIGTVTLNY